jgi:hypothetical protein
MNFYNNIISIISQIQEKSNSIEISNKDTLINNNIDNNIDNNIVNNIVNSITKKTKDTKNAKDTKDTKDTKEYLLKSYKVLSKVYDLIKNADLINNTIFLDKNWELLDYFDILSVGIPSKIIYINNINNGNNGNAKANTEGNVATATNAVIVKDFNLTHHTQYNYMRQEQALNKKKINIDYMKTYENDFTNIYYNLKRFHHNNEESIKKFGNKSRKKKIVLDEHKFIIDKSYGKILEKIDELLN